MTAKTFGVAGVALAMVLGTVACGPPPHGTDGGNGDAGCAGSACKADGGSDGGSKTVYSATYQMPSDEGAAESFSVVTMDGDGNITSSETVKDCLNDHACGVAFAKGQTDCVNASSCTVKTTSTDQVGFVAQPSAKTNMGLFV